MASSERFLVILSKYLKIKEKIQTNKTGFEKIIQFLKNV